MMDAAERAEKICSLLEPEEHLEEWQALLARTNFLPLLGTSITDQIRQAEQAAREDERGKVLEEAAVWHLEQADKFAGDEGDPASLKETARRTHMVAYHHFHAVCTIVKARALKDKP